MVNRGMGLADMTPAICPHGCKLSVVIPAKGASRPRAGIHSGTVVTRATVTEWVPDSLRFTPASGITADRAASFSGPALPCRDSEAWIPDTLRSCLAHAVGNDGEHITETNGYKISLQVIFYLTIWHPYPI
jgi:hypothetical protein